MALRKSCRALACPRRIPDEALFCNVHLRQLTPAILTPIAANREPTGTDSAGARTIIAGTTAAVAFIAKKEGRASDLKAAANAGQTVPGQTGSGGASTGASVQYSAKRQQIADETGTELIRPIGG